MENNEISLRLNILDSLGSEHMNFQEIRKIAEGTAINFQLGYLIVRIQTRSELSISLNSGRIENVSTSNESGMGIQAFTRKGASGFASANILTQNIANQLSRKAYELALENEKSGCELNTNIFLASKAREDIPSSGKYSFHEISPTKLQEITMEIHQRLLEIKIDQGNVVWQTNYRQIEDFWCIARQDGTLVSFVIPRSVILHQGTVKEEKFSQSFSVNRSGVDVEILLNEQQDQNLHYKAQAKTEFIQKVSSAPQIISGNYPVLIDYGLAKGLAHEAFGHAVESDLIEESILSENGKLRKGLIISESEIDIIDESIRGDWAYQPYSANGIIRKPVEIVKKGVLQNGLGDIFSSNKAGIEMTGAGRAEYYGSVPLPRMTNIRLETAETIHLPATLNLHDEILKLREVLKAKNLLEEEFHYVLIGYRGGQVNPKTGDFVFQCDGAVNLADPNLPIFQPGIFSGKILSVLQSVKMSLGEKKIDAIGTCGKAGQHVPSCGGASGYIFITKNENIRLGGNNNG